MKKYMIFGFTNIDLVDKNSEPSMEERVEINQRWRTWMSEMGELLLDMGSPLINGKPVDKNGLTRQSVSAISGYMKIQAEDLNHALELLNKSPLFENGHAQNYEIFECIM